MGVIYYFEDIVCSKKYFYIGIGLTFFLSEVQEPALFFLFMLTFAYISTFCLFYGRATRASKLTLKIRRILTLLEESAKHLYTKYLI